MGPGLLVTKLPMNIVDLITELVMIYLFFSYS